MERGLKMLWEASDDFDGWHIDKAVYPDKKWGKDMNSLIIEIRRDSKRA